MKAYLEKPILAAGLLNKYIVLMLVPLLAIALSSCGPRYADYFPYFDDGSAKPYVALVTLPESCETGFPAKLANFYDWYLREHIKDQAMLFLDTPKNIYAHQFSRQELFGVDLCAYKRFECEDFAVAIDILEHSLYNFSGIPCREMYAIAAAPCKRVLVMKVRLRIVDLQGCQCDREPKLVHQEIFTRRHMMPERNISVCGITSCACENYQNGPYYTAHTRMLRDLAQRIEEVICSY